MASHSAPPLSGPDTYCSALGWIRAGSRFVPVVPLIALRYFGYALLFLAAGIGITEGALRYLAGQGSVVSIDWVGENDSINKMNNRKVLNSAEHPIWRSAGIAPGPPTPGRRRILVIGDSFVWGDGYLNANDIWWRQLERELRHRGYFDVEIIAAGINGASTQQQLQWLQDPGYLEGIEPDLILLGYVTNDPDMITDDGQHLVRQIGREVPLPEWPGLDATLGRVAPTLAEQLKPKLTEKWASKLSDAYLYRDWERRLLTPPNIDAYARVVQALGEASRRMGTPVLVFTLPGAPSAETFGPLYTPVAPLFAAAGLPFFNLLDAFVRAYPPEDGQIGASILRWGVNPANGHPGPIATRFYAREVADVLERDAPRALGARSARPRPVAPKINDWMPPSVAVAQVAPAHWRLLYPGPGALAPRQPLGVPYVMLAFDLPVSIRAVRLSGERLRGARLWFTAVDPVTGAAIPDPLLGELRQGGTVAWTLAGTPGADRVNTLMIRADLGEQRPDRSIELAPEKISKSAGHRFATLVPGAIGESDDEDHLLRSAWVLLEDGVPLLPAHARHADIEALGGGRWSHWKGGVTFSSSDDSDPRKNGRRYRLVRYSGAANPLDLQIDFDEPGVRP